MDNVPHETPFELSGFRVVEPDGETSNNALSAGLVLDYRHRTPANLKQGNSGEQGNGLDSFGSGEFPAHRLHQTILKFRDQ